jgi:excisionase family DNA binding protein
MDKQYWTIKEASEALGVSEKTVRRRIRDGLLEAEQIQGKHGTEYRITVLEDTQPLDKSLDIEEDAALAKALDIIKTLQEENERLAGQVGYLQAQVFELDNKVRLLTGPANRRSWWQRLLWWRITPEA